jgi:hypothetical protein
LHKKRSRDWYLFRTILVGAPFQSRQCAVGAAPPFHFMGARDRNTEKSGAEEKLADLWG